jgi:predicted RNase H-like HicB family nuclease
MMGTAAKKQRYSVIIQWSEEDQAYVVTLPEWGGCHTHGSTYEEAARNAQEVLDLLTETEAAEGQPLPPAHGFMYPGPPGFTYELNQLAAPGARNGGGRGPKKTAGKLRQPVKAFRGTRA